MLEILSKDFLNWSKFSWFETQTTEINRIMIKNTGKRVIKDKDILPNIIAMKNY